MKLPALSPAVLDEIVALRRHFHRHPEIGMATLNTAALVEEKLREWGADRIERFADCGIAAEIRGNRPGRTVGLRADMDALPVPDRSCTGWGSRVEGCNHACGHDGHTAGLLGTARLLLEERDFPGRVICIFQPGEEGWAGARRMMEDGLFKTFPVDEIYAWHGAPSHRLGDITLYDGCMSASADAFSIKVHGRGGHGARPHQTTDSIVAASQLVCALQTIVSRNVNPQENAVLSIGSFHAGHPDAMTVIPSDVEIWGTTRSMNVSVQNMLEKRMNEICTGQAVMSGVQIKLDYDRRYPVLVNSHEQYEALVPLYRELLGDGHVDTTTPGSMGAEDFAFMLQAVPGLYIRIGLTDDEHTAPLHNEAFDFNDKALPLAIGLMAFTAVTRLKALSGE